VNLRAVVEEIRRAGGDLRLEGDERVHVVFPPGMEGLTPVLRDHKPELVVLLRAQGGRVATFPHCPKCASYALCRINNLGEYECMTCGLQNIEEQIARRLQ
jgi:hypothetical protein